MNLWAFYTVGTYLCYDCGSVCRGVYERKTHTIIFDGEGHWSDCTSPLKGKRMEFKAPQEQLGLIGEVPTTL